MDDRIKEVIDAYDRFQYYQDTFNGVYIYNNYGKDLKTILNFVGEELEGLEDDMYE